MRVDGVVQRGDNSVHAQLICDLSRVLERGVEDEASYADEEEGEVEGWP